MKTLLRAISRIALALCTLLAGCGSIVRYSDRGHQIEIDLKPSAPPADPTMTAPSPQTPKPVDVTSSIDMME